MTSAEPALDLGSIRPGGEWDPDEEKLRVEIDCPDLEHGLLAVWFTRRLLEHAAGQRVDGEADARSVVHQFGDRLVREVLARIGKDGQASVVRDPPAVIDFQTTGRPAKRGV